MLISYFNALALINRLHLAQEIILKLSYALDSKQVVRIERAGSEFVSFGHHVTVGHAGNNVKA